MNFHRDGEMIGLPDPEIDGCDLASIGHFGAQTRYQVHPHDILGTLEHAWGDRRRRRDFKVLQNVRFSLTDRKRNRALPQTKRIPPSTRIDHPATNETLRFVVVVTQNPVCQHEVFETFAGSAARFHRSLEDDRGPTVLDRAGFGAGWRGHDEIDAAEALLRFVREIVIDIHSDTSGKILKREALRIHGIQQGQGRRVDTCGTGTFRVGNFGAGKFGTGRFWGLAEIAGDGAGRDSSRQRTAWHAARGRRGGFCRLDLGAIARLRRGGRTTRTHHDEHETDGLAKDHDETP